MGYIGGGILLLVNIVMIFFGPKLTPDLGERGSTMLWMRLSLASVALWWAIFSIPLFRRVQEPTRMAEAGEVGEKVWKVGFARFLKAFKDIRKFKDYSGSCSPSWYMPTVSAPSSPWPLHSPRTWASAQSQFWEPS